MIMRVFLYSFTILISSAFAEDFAIRDERVEALAPTLSDEQRELFNKISVEPVVQKYFTECNKDKDGNPVPLAEGQVLYSTTGSGQHKFVTCVVNNLTTNGEIDPLINKYVGKNTKESKHGAQEKFLLNYNFSEKRKPAIKALNKYLSKRLKEALYGEIQDEMTGQRARLVSHTIFYDLYKNQISQNILMSLSAYCIDANEDHLIKDDPRQDNLDRLSKFTDEGENVAFGRFGDCIKNIKHVCHGTDKYYHEEVKEDDRTDIQNIATNDESRQRSCAVTTNIRGLRASLMKTIAIQERFKKIATESGPTRSIAGATGDRDIYSEGAADDEKTVGELTSMTSTEYGKIKHKDGKTLDERNQELALELKEKCQGNKEEDICKKYIDFKDDTEKLKELLNNYALKSSITIEQISQLRDDEGKLVEFLEREGRTEEQIKELLENTPEEIVNNIKNQFELEKNQVIAALHSRIQEDEFDSPVNIAGQIDGAGKKISNTVTFLENDVKKYRQLLLYSNMVSGYLDFGTKDEDNNFTKEGKNTASIFRELDDYDTRAPAADTPEMDLGVDLGSIQEQVLAAGIEKPSDEDSRKSNSYTVDDINKYNLNYDQNIPTP
jgi:uncharacterized protein YciI